MFTPHTAYIGSFVLNHMQYAVCWLKRKEPLTSLLLGDYYKLLFQDRVLMLRVEQVCFCVISGEWPTTTHSLLPSMSNTIDSVTPTLGRSQASTPLSEDRVTPVPTSFSNMLPNANEVNLLAGKYDLTW